VCVSEYCLRRTRFDVHTGVIFRVDFANYGYVCFGYLSMCTLNVSDVYTGCAQYKVSEIVQMSITTVMSNVKLKLTALGLHTKSNVELKSTYCFILF
jgi:hypothetical protein